MAPGLLRRYFKFVSSRRFAYLQFNKQLIIGELAGFGAGIIVAEAVAHAGSDGLTISTYSSVADYGASVMGFLAVYYKDQKLLHPDDKSYDRLKKILSGAFKLWPSAVAADIAFVAARPYFHYAAMTLDFGPGVAAAVAHVLAFGLFNLVAVFSRSFIDYAKHVRMKVS
jgi:hypothetical protein